MTDLEQFKTQTPQGVLYSLQEMVHRAQELQNKVESNAVLDVEDREHLKEFIASMRAFFHYVYPSLERVAYSRLNETELVRSDHLASLRDAIECHLTTGNERLRMMGTEIEHLRQTLDERDLADKRHHI